MPGEAQPRIFLSYSLSDDAGRTLRDMLGDRFEVTTPEMLTGDVVRSTALRRSLIQTDVAVVVLPTADDPSWRNVLFEAGAAAGVGVPVILVGEAVSAPADLADSLIFNPHQIDEVISLIEVLAHGNRTFYQRDLLITEEDHFPGWEQVTSPPPVPALSSEYVDQWITRLKNVRSERSAVSLISDLFQQSGARVRTESQANAGQVVDKPDLVLWHDDLLATFGLPLPVEVLLKARAWPAVRSRLERTLTASGGRSLVAVAVRDGMNSKVWTDGRRTILVSSAIQLAESLAQLPLAEALSAILASAAS
jgi:hypothetical protein